jgi:hypothetical protein
VGLLPITIVLPLNRIGVVQEDMVDLLKATGKGEEEGTATMVLHPDPGLVDTANNIPTVHKAEVRTKIRVLQEVRTEDARTTNRVWGWVRWHLLGVLDCSVQRFLRMSLKSTKGTKRRKRMMLASIRAIIVGLITDMLMASRTGRVLKQRGTNPTRKTCKHFCLVEALQ